ncbi:MAG: beta-lactamase family protein [Planctomyces sp.]|nr:beta-lactamase family protein [Planctomyces sp.]
MSLLKPLFIVSLFAFLQASGFAQSNPNEISVASPADVGMSAEKLAKVDAAMDELVMQKRIAGGIVMIARHGKIAHFNTYGLRDIENDQPMEKDTIFRIYSMTKAITTAAALMLHEEGKLNVNDPVSKYIPELKQVQVISGTKIVPATRAMTIADLMRHTSGYGYGWEGNTQYNVAFLKADPLNAGVPLSRMQTKLDEIPLQFEPGTDWTYGISIDVLGRVIEVASGQTLLSFFEERFFKPLDMKDTGFHVPADKVHRFANCYNSDGKGNLTIADDARNSRYLEQPLFEGGGGGLVSTARDYMRFLLMIQGDGEFQGKRYLKPETVAMMKTNQVPESVGWIKFGNEVRDGVGFSYGFSVRVKSSAWDPDGRVGEFGWGGMASTHYWVSPTDDLSVITLEQVLPYSFLTEFKVKGLIYDAIEQ